MTEFEIKHGLSQDEPGPLEPVELAQQHGAAPATGNTARDQEMYVAGIRTGEENAKHNAAIRAGVPEGWKLVPVKATDEMEAAAENDYGQTGYTFPRWKSHYAAMLNAAPAAPGVSTAEAQPVAWMDPDTQDVISAGRKASWLNEYGAGGAAKAATYTRALGDLRPAPAAGDALGAVTLVTRQGRGQELFTYTSQPCDNVIAWRIGEACSKASVTSAGDYIDRGLSLLKELQRKGYGIADISAAQRKGDA